MKIRLYIFILFSTYMILFGCRKDKEIYKYYTDLEDIVIEPINDPPREELKTATAYTGEYLFAILQQRHCIAFEDLRNR